MGIGVLKGYRATGVLQEFMCSIGYMSSTGLHVYSSSKRVQVYINSTEV
jgi:hypothetical protein